MVSSAIASLDAWIQQAEELLAELREQGLSPSSAPLQDPGTRETTITLGHFAEGLEEVLRALCERPGRWLFIVEDARRPNRYWQAICYEDGSLFVEVVSNHYLAGDDRLTDADGTWLESHGWKVPDPPKWPNWSMVEATTSPAVSEITGQAIEAMREVFGLADGDLVLTKLFPSQLRGDSPASPDPRDDTDPVDPVTPSTEGIRFPALDRTVAGDIARRAALGEQAFSEPADGTLGWLNPDGGLDVPPSEFEAAYAAQQTDQQLVGNQ